MSRTKSAQKAPLKLARHPEVVTMYRIMRGTEVLTDNLETLDDALLWHSVWVWRDRTVEALMQKPSYKDC